MMSWSYFQIFWIGFGWELGILYFSKCLQVRLKCRQDWGQLDINDFIICHLTFDITPGNIKGLWNIMKNNVTWHLIYTSCILKKGILFIGLYLQKNVGLWCNALLLSVVHRPAVSVSHGSLVEMLRLHPHIYWSRICNLATSLQVILCIFKFKSAGQYAMR